MRILFMGTPESAVPSLRRLVEDGHEIVAVWTQPDKPAGRGKKLHESPVKTFAIANELSVHQPAKIRTQEAKELFASHNADATVVVAYGKILPAEFLNSPREVSINVHFSLLPKYRGAAPVNWAIVNGEEQTGVTTMKIVEELDAGPVLLQKASRIEAGETAPELLARLSHVGSELISETLRNLKSLTPKPQLDEDATFAPILKRKDGLIDWSMDAFAIERRVRGFQPWPNAYTALNSRNLIIWQAAPERSASNSGSPAHGQIVEARGDNLIVACGEQTALRVLEAQPQDGRRMTARDLLNGTHLKAGTRLGHG